MGYIGRIGAMQKLICSKEMGKQYTASPTFQKTLGGKDTAQLPPSSRREWTITALEKGSADAATLEAIQAGLLGRKPLFYLPETALHGNALTPEQSLMARALPSGFTAGGPRNVGGVFTDASVLVPAGKSFYLTQEGSSFVQMPLLPGKPLTATAFVDTPARISILTYSATGVYQRAVTSATSLGAGFHQISVTLTPRAEEASYLVSVRADLPMVVALPAAFYKENPQPWGVGQACSKAVPHSYGDSMLGVSHAGQGYYAQTSITIREVG